MCGKFTAKSSWTAYLDLLDAQTGIVAEDRPVTYRVIAYIKRHEPTYQLAV